MSSASNPKIVYANFQEQAETHRIENQSTDEWYQEYDAYFIGGPSCIKSRSKPNPHDSGIVNKHLYVFESFRTTREGRLVISLVNIDNGGVVDAFFNVDINRQRGNGKYDIGANGQFFPKPKSKFRMLWMESVKKVPRRWATVHKEMRTKLKGLIFEGELKVGYRSNGEPFNQLFNIVCLETRMEQDGNKAGTIWEQGCE